ncbi:DUF1697 domain-containing protein [Streptococcus dentapri]|uniref:DUF1697 domain-containing protein n=1 Tax=Streptococcus dentapri TaxID=573564 RepID=A0ABV8D0F3_9STRE
MLRDINIGDKRKAVMTGLKQLIGSGCQDVVTYIKNRGNLFFDSERPLSVLKESFTALFEKHYPFVKSFVLLSQIDYQKDADRLPAWWEENLARKDVLFYSDKVDRSFLEDRIAQLPLTADELVHFGKSAVFWGKKDEKNYLKTAYHKYLLKEPFYKDITIRNGKT